MFIAGPSAEEQFDTQQQVQTRTRARRRALAGCMKRSGLHCGELVCGAPALAAAAPALLCTVVRAFDYDWQRHTQVGAASQSGQVSRLEPSAGGATLGWFACTSEVVADTPWAALLPAGRAQRLRECKVVPPGPALIAGLTGSRVEEERAAVLARESCSPLRVAADAAARVLEGLLHSPRTRAAAAAALFPAAAAAAVPEAELDAFVARQLAQSRHGQPPFMWLALELSRLRPPSWALRSANLGGDEANVPIVALVARHLRAQDAVRSIAAVRALQCASHVAGGHAALLDASVAAALTRALYLWTRETACVEGRASAACVGAAKVARRLHCLISWLPARWRAAPRCKRCRPAGHRCRSSLAPAACGVTPCLGP